MERMDRVRRRAGLAWVVGGLGFEVVLAGTHNVRPGRVTVILGSLVVLLAVLMIVSAPRRLVVAARHVVAIALALDFAGAVADRFGAFGPPGQPGVSWGSWTSFVDYTQVLLLGAPRPLAAAAALLATVVEIALSVLLLSGYQRRWVGKATAGLLVVYLASMAWSLGWSPVAIYAVPVLVGGALLVSVRPTQDPTHDPTPSGSRPETDRDQIPKRVVTVQPSGTPS